ncbi:MAG: 2-C-methyl-D-erythritol 2,4-cyclodiphosphate synthase [candidate division BRC1 bacterium ADurb.BinA364]|nr:MAG: 2-C-methyl-D-erythritol 2,4-cyclodiphosphate synthase [candidate division BRC1 bacterium ADurb.BinA364]
MTIRVGFGFDVHRFADGRPLMIGAVEIPYPRGLAGHSDADVLLHAICDALLGAMGQGDIGQLFPDHDPKYKDIPSVELLREVARLAREQGWRVVNVDATVVAEAPKIAPHRILMQTRIAQTLGLDGRVSVKATTTEGLGYTGRGEGMAAYAVALLEKEGGGQ